MSTSKDVGLKIERLYSDFSSWKKAAERMQCEVRQVPDQPKTAEYWQAITSNPSCIVGFFTGGQGRLEDRRRNTGVSTRNSAHYDDNGTFD